jgi:hypothetical protein
MRMRNCLLPFAAAALLLAARTASAQELAEPRQRQGYYVAGGVHAAVAYSRDRGDSLGPWGGYATTVRLGQLLTRRLGVGIQLDLAGASGDDRTASLMGLGVGGQLEVAPNLAVHAGVGFGVVSLDDPERDETRGGYGAAYTLALTYDWFPGNRRSGGWAITPGLRARAVPSDTVDSFALLAGVEISYWTGLPKNQLALPDSEAYASR